MKLTYLTLFPDLIQHVMASSLMGRAQANQLLDVSIVNPRDFTVNKHKKVDDTPYGGGAGMVLACQPFDDAFASIQPLSSKARVLMMTPTGRPFDQATAKEFAQADQLVFFCGHYEGFDERIHQLIPQLEEVSLGDYVVTGGELPALMITDAVARLVPGVVKEAASVENDSFYKGLLDYPHYTRPAEYKGLTVPEVLLSGDHRAIALWRAEQAQVKTLRQRPDLLTD